MPKILFVDHASVLGGAELSLLDIARQFKSESQTVLFSDGPFRLRLEEAGVNVRLLRTNPAVMGVTRDDGIKKLLAIPGVVDLVWQVRQLGAEFDLFYANSQKSFVVSALAGALSRRPVVWHLRDILSQEHFSAANMKVVITLANLFATKIIANSQATADAFIARGGNPNKVRVIYNGIDPSPFTQIQDRDALAARRELRIEKDTPLLGLFSRLAPWKGQHVVLEALEKLPHVHVMLVGEALFGEEAYALSLREQASALGISNRVHFLGFRADIPALMKAADVVLHSSISPEPFGRVIVEGMLAERPVVATRAGGAIEIIQEGVTGLLVSPGDSTDLATQIERLLAAPSHAKSLAVTGHKHAIEKFSLQSLINGVAAQIAEVLSAPVEQQPEQVTT